MATSAQIVSQHRWLELHWRFVAMVTVAIGISYFDRQTISVAIASIQHSIPVSQQQFSYLSTAFLLAYAAMYLGAGRLLDRIGTRRGFLLIMIWWSIAAGLHSLATGFTWLVAMRFLLGMGEGGAFPAATRVVSEWIPAHERSTAMGVINAGTAFGSVLAPPVIGFVLLHSGWRAVFLTASAVGLIWSLWWALSYRTNDATLSRNTLDARILGAQLTFHELLALPLVRSLVFAKFLSDAAWFFLLFWLPKYLYDARGFDIKQVSLYAWIPYAASGVGSFLGGWASSYLLRRGRSLNQSRKIVLGVNALMMPAVMFVPHVAVGYALLLFSIAFFAQQSWSGLIMTLPADIFPLSAVGTVAGLVGLGGSLGGAIFGLIAGAMLGRGVSYATLFLLAGSFHFVGFLALTFWGGAIQPLRSTDLLEMESNA